MSRRGFSAATAAAAATLVLPRAAEAFPVRGCDVTKSTPSDFYGGQLRYASQGQQPASIEGRKNMVSDPVVRVSILRCDAAQFDKLVQMSSESEAALRPGIERMAGLLAFYAGADPATCSLTNTSLWDSMEHAQQLDHFQPMLEAGKRFAAAGARFERPVMNYATLWRFGPLSGSQR